MAYLDDAAFVLNIQPIGLPTIVRLSQNENGRRLYFTIIGNETAIPSGVTVTLSGTKPDGVVYSKVGSISNGVVLINEDTQLTAAAGNWDAKIKIVSGGQTVATGRVRFIIDADPVAPGSVPSDSQLEGLVAEAEWYAENARSAAYGSPLVASTVAGMTDHTRVYVYTGSETGYTAGNWYYWNGSAWTSGGVYNSTALQTDTTLAIPGMAADAKATGDAIDGLDDRLTDSESELADVKSDLSEITPGAWSEEAKVALLTCLEHVFWRDAAETYIEDLRTALAMSNRRPELPNEYEQVEYIVGNGNQWITLGIVSQIPFTVDATVLFTRNDGNVFTGDSASVGANSNFRIFGYNNFGSGQNTDVGMRIGNNNWIYAHGYDLNTIYNIKSGVYQTGNEKKAYIQVDDDERVETTLVNSPNLGYLMRIYKRDGDSWVGRGVRFYSLICYAGGNQKIFDGIPCYRKSDEVSGLYDVVSEHFYSSEGTENFSVGEVVR